MSSTGEVGCLGDDVNCAILKSMLSVGLRVPNKEKGILISSGNAKQKAQLLTPCKQLADAGYKLYATGGSYRYLVENNIPCEHVYWPSEEMQPQALDMVRNKEVDMVINIPKNLTSGELSNGYKIRRAAIDFNVPLLTNDRLASAFINAFTTISLDDLAIKAWDEYK